MENVFSYKPNGVCSSKMIIRTDRDVIRSVEIIGGCPGNSLGVSKLCVGRRIDDVIDILKGIDCRGRGTSCPDQLACALLKLKEQINVPL